MAALPIIYTTVEEVRSTIPFIQSATTVTSAVIAEFIGREEAKMNGYLANRYLLPLSGTYPILQAIASDLSAYSVLAKNDLLSQTQEDSPWPARYKEAWDDLKAIASGDAKLVSTSGTVLNANATPAVPWSDTQNYTPTLAPLPPPQLHPDPNRVQALEDLRND